MYFEDIHKKDYEKNKILGTSDVHHAATLPCSHMPRPRCHAATPTAAESEQRRKSRFIGKKYLSSIRKNIE